jgi:hypothetical protein
MIRDMKKTIIALSGVILIAFVVIMVANAQSTPQEVKKAATEASMDCSKCPSAATCEKMKEGKTCDMAKCKEAGCDPAKCKEGKCDPAKCKANCSNASGEAKKCDPAACKGAQKK